MTGKLIGEMKQTDYATVQPIINDIDNYYIKFKFWVFVEIIVRSRNNSSSVSNIRKLKY